MVRWDLAIVKNSDLSDKKHQSIVITDRFSMFGCERSYGSQKDPRAHFIPIEKKDKNNNPEGKDVI